MSVTITKKQVQALARTLEVPGLSYLQRIDAIARALGHANQAALMAALEAPAAAPAETTLSDWRAAGDAGVSPAPVPVRVEASPYRMDMAVGAGQPALVAVEREGNMTRVMVYDSLCDFPRVLGIPDGAAMVELPHDWEPLEPGDLEV